MARKDAKPIITHAEIYSRAIRSIDAEIAEWKGRCEGIPAEQAEEMLTRATAHLTSKREALEAMYRIETGTDHD